MEALETHRDSPTHEVQNLSSAVDRIWQALVSGKYDWRSAKGIAQDAGLPESEVIETLEGKLADKVVKSVSRGKYLYTTRDHYNQLRGFWGSVLTTITDRVR